MKGHGVSMRKARLGVNGRAVNHLEGHTESRDRIDQSRDPQRNVRRVGARVGCSAQVGEDLRTWPYEKRPGVRRQRWWGSSSPSRGERYRGGAADGVSCRRVGGGAVRRRGHHSHGDGACCVAVACAHVRSGSA